MGMSIGVPWTPVTITNLELEADLNMGGSAFEVLGRKLAAGAAVLDSEDTIVAITSDFTTYVKYHEVDIPTDIVAGVVRVSVAVSPDYSAKFVYTKWMVNGVISPGGEQSYEYVAASTYETETEDIYVRPGDHIEWWMTAKADGNYYHYKEVRVKGVESARSKVAWNLT